MYTIAVEADYHSGHRAGLTPPKFWARDEWRIPERELWNIRKNIIKEEVDPDLLIINGDLIDGRGQASGGTELLTSSLVMQAHLAAVCALQWKTHKVMITRGTPYHTGWGGEDWEDLTADAIRNSLTELYGPDCQVEIDDQLFITINGVTLDVKHHVGSTVTPYTGGTAMIREKVWNEAWWLDGKGQPLADIILRAHAHFHEGYWGIRNGKPWYAIRQPALQAATTKYGKKCTRRLDWGLLMITIDDDGAIDIRPHIVAVKANKHRVIVL